MQGPSPPPPLPSQISSLFLAHVAAVLSPQTPQAERKISDEWLNEFSKSTQAWECLLPLLASPCDVQVTFLSAQMLNRKIRYDFEQLVHVPGAAENLRAGVVNALITYKDVPTVQTQLSLALVALAIQMESWTNSIQDLIKGLGDTHLGSMLQVLRLVPEEVDDASLDVTMHRRFTFKSECLTMTSDILKLLVKVTVYLHEQEREKNQAQAYKGVMDCLGAWIVFSDISGPELAQSQILETAFRCISRVAPLLGMGPTNESTFLMSDFDAAISLLIEVVYRYRLMDLEDMPVIQYVVPRVFDLYMLYNLAENRQGEIAVHVLEGLAHLFASMCESFVHLIVEPPEMQQVRLVELALRVFSHPDHTIAQRTIKFWFDLLHELNVCDNEVKELRITQITPLLTRLVEVCVRLRLVAMPSWAAGRGGGGNSSREDHVPGDDEDDDDDMDRYQDWNESEGPSASDFTEHRLDVCDILHRTISVRLETSATPFAVPKIVEITESLVTQYLETQNVQETDQIMFSRHLEACLMAYECVARDISWYDPRDTIGIGIKTMMSIAMEPRIIRDDVRLVKASCSMLAMLSQHISKHSNVYLESTFQFLSNALRIRGAEARAGRALRALTATPVAEAMFPRFSMIADILNPHDESLPDYARLDCVECLVQILAVVPESLGDPMEQQRAAAFSSLFEPFFNIAVSPGIGNGGDSSFRHPNPKHFTRTEFALQALTIAIRDLAPPHHDDTPHHHAQYMEQSPPPLLVQLMTRLWSQLEMVVRGKNEGCVEFLTRLIKHAVRGWTQYCKSHIPRIVSFVVDEFIRQPHSGYLYAAGVILAEYCGPGTESFRPVFASMLQHMITRSLTVLNSTESFVEFPNFVEDMYYLANRAVEQIPEDIVGLPFFNDVFAAAAYVGVKCEQREAFRSVATFLENLIMLGVPTTYQLEGVGGGGHDDDRQSQQQQQHPEIYVLLRRHIEVHLEAHGTTLMNNLIVGAAGTLPIELVCEDTHHGTVTHVVFALRDFWGPQRFATMLHVALLHPECAHLSNEVRGWFAEALEQGTRQGVYQYRTVLEEFGRKGRRRKGRKV